MVQVCTKLKCSAEQFKWLWAIRSIVEKIMLRECRTVADRFVDYCKRAAKEGADQMVHNAPVIFLHLPTKIVSHVLTYLQCFKAQICTRLFRKAESEIFCFSHTSMK